jgi:hypothetical protein
MIFAFVDDGTLEVYDTLAEVQSEFEGVDVESGAVHFYDKKGIYLEPRFTTPNRSGKIIGQLSWVASGTYDLVPNPNAEQDSFARALYKTAVLNPNPWFPSLEALKSSLASQGVVVE